MYEGNKWNRSRYASLEIFDCGFCEIVQASYSTFPLVRSPFTPLCRSGAQPLANKFYSVPFIFLFQMVQAIQVLRFHLLELEKVSTFQIPRFLPISKAI